VSFPRKKKFLTKKDGITAIRRGIGGCVCHAGSNARGGIQATPIGFEIMQSVRKYMPSVVSTDLTRSMEEQLDEIESSKVRSTIVIQNAIDELKRTMSTFKKKEIEIGRQITEAVIISQNQEHQQHIVVGTCPVCNKGILRIIRSRLTKKRSVGCSNYSLGVCKGSAPLPQKGSTQTTTEKCASCGWPVLRAVYAAKHPWEFCINIHCPSKKHQLESA
jgi:DNA topoisomerase I